MKKIILCADDYALSPEVSLGILELLKNQRLSAVSCITTTPYWTEYASYLSKFHGRIDIGLHFNLTENLEFANRLGYKQPISLKKFMYLAFSRQLQQTDIEKELAIQIDKFIATTQHMPNFIDGHEHIHHLPLVRNALISVYQKKFKSQQVYIRSCVNFPLKLTFLKSWVISYTGALKLRKLLIHYNIPFNSSFSGVYNFTHARFYPTLFLHFLKKIQNNGLIMCHPGFHTHNPTDLISQARRLELKFFNSDNFLKLCHINKIEISRFKFHANKS